MLARAAPEGLNITDVVQRCVNICSLALGTGNLDLSGVGVSSLIPAHLTMSTNLGLSQPFIHYLGWPFLSSRPCFCLVWKLGQEGFYLSELEIEENFELIRDPFTDINAQFSIVVATDQTRCSEKREFFQSHIGTSDAIGDIDQSMDIK